MTMHRPGNVDDREVLSGILEEQLPDMLVTLKGHDILLQSQIKQEGWIALIGTRVDE